MTTYAPCGVILFAAWVSFLDTSHGADAISHRSPDKKFALLTTEEATAARFYLVALPGKRKLLELPPEFGASVVLTWSPDSRRFAVCDDDFDHDPPGRYYQAHVYGRTGDSFKRVALPDLRYPAESWPRGSSRQTGSEHVTPVRWADAHTLLFERTNWTLLDDGATSWRLTSEIKLRFSKEGRPVVQEVRTIKTERKRE
jgi:hypothetical protein